MVNLGSHDDLNNSFDNLATKGSPHFRIPHGRSSLKAVAAVIENGPPQRRLHLHHLPVSNNLNLGLITFSFLYSILIPIF